MKIWSRKFLVLALVGMLAGVAACGEPEDEDNQDNATNQNNDEQNNNQNNTNQNGGDVPACEDMSDLGIRDGDPDMTGVADYAPDYDLIFNAFAFDDESPANGLNPVVDLFMDQEDDYPIIVLVELSDIDTATGDLMIRGGAGLHAGEPGGGEYVWDVSEGLEEPDSAQGTIDGEGRMMAALPLLNFVATVETDEEPLKTIIPIRNIQLDAVVDVAADGSDPSITDGDLAGVIYREDVAEVQIALVPGAEGLPLTQVLDRDPMNCDFSGDGEADAWALWATFSAEQTVIVE